MIGFDIDGTLTTLEKTVEIFNRETGKILTMEDIKHYAIGLNYGISVEDELRIWKNHEKEMNKFSLPNERVVNHYKDLSKLQPLVIITAREESMREITLDWLKKHELVYSDIFFGDHDKTMALKKFGVHVFYDANYSNVLAMNKLGGTGILINQPYNKELNYERMF